MAEQPETAATNNAESSTQGPHNQEYLLLTGASSGIGRAIAEKLVQPGRTLILSARSVEKMEQQRSELLEREPEAQVHVLRLDLADLQQVRAFASNLTTHYPYLDVLLNNAGIVAGGKRETTPDDFELTMGVNYFGPFLLTYLLLPHLLRAPQPLVINTSSAAHSLGGLRLADLNFTKGYDRWKAYGASKLANILHAQALAERYADQGLHAHSFHPGFVDSGFGKQTQDYLKVVLFLLKPLQRSPEKGADTAVWLVRNAIAQRTNGHYWVDRKQKTPRISGGTPHLANALWEETLRQLELPPEPSATTDA